MSTEGNAGILDTCYAVCWILAVAAGLFVGTVCIYWADVNGLVSAVIGLIALLGAGYLFPQMLCAGRDEVPDAPEEPVAAAAPTEPVEPGVVPAPEPEQDIRKPKLFDTSPDNTDDLKVISGVGPALERKLNDLGIYTYAQIAGWTDADVAWVDEKLNFRGRIERDNWVQQAKTLVKG